MSLINQIISLQEVDNKLFEIEKLLGDLPSKVEELISVFELKKIKVHKEFIANMDPTLIQALPMKLLKEELIQLSQLMKLAKK